MSPKDRRFESTVTSPSAARRSSIAPPSISSYRSTEHSRDGAESSSTHGVVSDRFYRREVVRIFLGRRNSYETTAGLFRRLPTTFSIGALRSPALSTGR